MAGIFVLIVFLWVFHEPLLFVLNLASVVLNFAVKSFFVTLLLYGFYVEVLAKTH